MLRPWAALLKAAVVKPRGSWEQFLAGDDEDEDDEALHWKVA
jgi:hypothetical protein